MNHTRKLQNRFESALMANYGTPPVAVAGGEGCVVWDVDGARYLDLIGGLAVSALGHAHPAVVAAVSRQVRELAHISNLYLHEPAVRLAERLLGLLDADGRVFFANSGAEANEAALKLVRKHAGPDRPYVVAAHESFHGRTMGALGLTGRPTIRDPFGPFGGDVRFVSYGGADELAAAVDARCAAVFLEPIQGEAGVVPPPPGYLRAAREICDATGALLVLDEVQSGIGRTGDWFAHRREGVRPDVLTLAKGLGGGLPISACVGLGAYGSVLVKGDHGSTFGGNPVSCAAALAVVDTIERDGLLVHVAEAGKVLADGIRGLEHPLVAEVRGRGLWRAIVLTERCAAAVEGAARDAGFLVNAVRPDAVRLSPPLILSFEEIRSFVTALPSVLGRTAEARAGAL
ncbi:acetylornithine transaminase [Actinomadura roseirufa]|uniref:acetylornithine transaminase n=1 Tax=Actinomadura roseirufa TaxID=2094049 RepID=UPI0010412532|nr:acetylornithine transaminase [Actinomadura roseirufa]